MSIDSSTEKPHVVADNVGALLLEGKVVLPRLLPEIRQSGSSKAASGDQAKWAAPAAAAWPQASLRRSAR
jgi:hypothetical protein